MALHTLESANTPVYVKIVAVNDFHGQLPPGQTLTKRPTGAVREDIPKGYITWGDLYAVQPFSDSLVSMTLTGEQIATALERQYQNPPPPHNLAVSGLSYTYDPAQPEGRRVVNVSVNGVPPGKGKTYTVAMDAYLAGGGDSYMVFTQGRGVITGPADIDALVPYFGSLPQPVNAAAGGRITRLG
jgi:5'-nucleotidase